jgi:oligopeptide/dipeptide ABC transporter ATP-binding protein
MRMLPSLARVEAGELRFDGCNLLELREHELCALRGSEISIIFQDSNVLNPVMRAGDQVIEILRAHRQGTKAQMKEEVIDLFHALGLDDSDRIFRAYPHQLSGGQRRRITIAQALICKPRLVIADEPTAWLDVGRTAEILDLMTRLRDALGTAFLLISHDPHVLATVADRAMVMYAGQIVESGPAAEVFNRPMHPYSRALLQCASPGVVRENRARRTLPFIPGSAPDPSAEIRGCSFSERCKDRMDICVSNEPQLVAISGQHSAQCFLHGGVA